MDLEQYLSSKTDCGPSVDADTLKLYGHKAAAQFVGGQASMNDSIAQMAKEANLNPEQVKRVVEHANNLAFSQMFKAGFSQNITFPMADTSVIMQNLEAPMQVKQASAEIVKGARYIPGQERVSLESAFGYNAVTRAIEKTASPKIDRTSLARDYIDKLGSVRKMQSDMELLADSFELRLRHLDGLVKQAHTEGWSAEAIGCCVEAANPSQVIGRYLGERYGDQVVTGSLTKIAQMGMEVASNPITDAVSNLQNMQEQLFQLQDSIALAQEQVGAMLQTMRQPIHEDGAEKLFRPSAAAPSPGASGMPPAMQGMMPPAPAPGGQGPAEPLEVTPGPM